MQSAKRAHATFSEQHQPVLRDGDARWLLPLRCARRRIPNVDMTQSWLEVRAVHTDSSPYIYISRVTETRSGCYVTFWGAMKAWNRPSPIRCVRQAK